MNAQGTASTTLRVELNTKTVTPKQQWLEERQSFIGGSEVFELLNEKQYGRGCQRALAYRKLGVPPDYPEQVDDALLERGNLLEPLVAAMYEAETGRRLRRGPLNEYGLPKPQIHKEFPWAGVHVDRIVLAGHGGVHETGTAEIKTHGEGPYLNILRNGLQPGHILQEQWGQWVRGHNWGPFIILGVFGGLPLKHQDIQHNPRADEVFKRDGERFANTVWGKGELPDRPFDGDDQRCKVCAFRMECRGEELDRAEAAAIKAEKNGKVPLVQISNPVLSQSLAKRDEIKREIRALSNPEPSSTFPDPGALDMVEEEIERELGDVTAALVDGYGKVYHGTTKGRTTIAREPLAAYLGDIALQAQQIVKAAEIVPDPFKNEIVAQQTLTLLRSVAELSTTVSSKYTKTGEPYKTLRTYPLGL
jgi:predicted phage-related endonuclease